MSCISALPVIRRTARFALLTFAVLIANLGIQSALADAKSDYESFSKHYNAGRYREALPFIERAGQMTFYDRFFASIAAKQGFEKLRLRSK